MRPTAAGGVNTLRAGSGWLLRARGRLAAVALGLCLCGSGCVHKPLVNQTASFSTAAGLVVDNSTNAYRAAIDLHDQEQASAGVLRFEQGLAWDPHSIKPLISPKGLKARLQVLAALKTYAQTLADVSSGVDSPDLDSAAESVGSGLEALGTAFNTIPAAAPLGFSVDTETANGVSTAARALGEFLVERRVRSSVPAITRRMAPAINTLCKLLTDDVDILRAQSKKDYEDLLRQQTVFVRENDKQLTPSERRDEIIKLPTILRNEQTADSMLTDLHDAIGRLAKTHDALADAEQTQDQESLRVRIAELKAAGENLAHYYQGLPTS